MIVCRLAMGANIALRVPITIVEAPVATRKKLPYLVDLGSDASSTE
jgi:hypothetical protein